MMRMILAALGAAAVVMPATAQLAVGMRLEDAGFKMREANTPQKMERLRQVPPHKIVARQKNGVPYYLYADPDYCKCLFVGDKIAFDAFRAMPQRPLQPDDVDRGGGSQLVPEMVDEMNRDGALDVDDMIDPGS